MEKIQIQEIVGEVVKLAKERPEFVYKSADLDGSCSYVGGRMRTPEEGKGCIIGQALQRLGMPVEELLKHEGDDVVSLIIANPYIVGGDGFADRDARSFLDYVQSLQDRKETWGDAVKQAASGYPGML